MALDRSEYSRGIDLAEAGGKKAFLAASNAFNEPANLGMANLRDLFDALGLTDPAKESGLFSQIERQLNDAAADGPEASRTNGADAPAANGTDGDGVQYASAEADHLRAAQSEIDARAPQAPENQTAQNGQDPDPDITTDNAARMTVATAAAGPIGVAAATLAGDGGDDTLQGNAGTDGLEEDLPDGQRPDQDIFAPVGGVMTQQAMIDSAADAGRGGSVNHAFAYRGEEGPRGKDKDKGRHDAVSFRVQQIQSQIIANIDRQIAEYEKEYNDLAVERADLVERRAEVGRDIAESEERLDEIETDIRNYENLQTDFQEDIARLEDLEDNLESELGGLAARHAEINEELADRKAEIQEQQEAAGDDLFAEENDGDRFLYDDDGNVILQDENGNVYGLGLVYDDDGRPVLDENGNQLTERVEYSEEQLEAIQNQIDENPDKNLSESGYNDYLEADRQATQSAQEAMAEAEQWAEEQRAAAAEQYDIKARIEEIQNELTDVRTEITARKEAFEHEEQNLADKYGISVDQLRNGELENLAEAEREEIRRLREIGNDLDEQIAEIDTKMESLEQKIADLKEAKELVQTPEFQNKIEAYTNGDISLDEVTQDFPPWMRDSIRDGIASGNTVEESVDLATAAAPAAAEAEQSASSPRANGSAASQYDGEAENQQTSTVAFNESAQGTSTAPTPAPAPAAGPATLERQVAQAAPSMAMA